MIFFSRYFNNLFPMLKQEFQHMRVNAIQGLCESPAENEAVIVQIYNIAVDQKNKLTCFLSDGNYCVKAFLKEKSSIQPQKNEFSLIRIKQHVVGDSGKKVGIVNFDLICEYNKQIGSPKPLDIDHLPNPEEVKPQSIELKNITNKHVNMLQDSARKQPAILQSAAKSVKKEEPKRDEKKEMRLPVAKPLTGSVKDYETIKGLFVGLKNWHLLCRITKLDYQQFTKKNSDKLVKILNIELMDRSEVKIAGVFFYEAAEKFREELKLNSIYKISEGTISNENYNNTKNQKMSPFKLTFSMNSVFEEVSDVHIIARTEDSAITLNDLLNKQIYDQEFDIIGILAEIEEPKEITKGDKVLTRWNWTIADPIQEKKIHAVMWNDRFLPDQSLVGKTIIMSRFTLHNYNGSLTLNSKIRSGIQLATHAYQTMEEKVMTEFKNYELVSERKMKEEDNSQGTTLKNMRELNDAIQYLSLGESLKSDLDVWVNRLSMKKWFYEGCPSCNKSSEKGTNCQCGKYVEQTIPHFILGIELSDAFGSLYSTAYDEQAKRIFWDDSNAIHKLMKLDPNQLKDVTEDYIFQQFKVRIYTKKDEQGRLKHNMGKLQHKIPQKLAQQNVQRIKQLMRELMM